nr:hypothetical protein [uncultured bacterium]
MVTTVIYAFMQIFIHVTAKNNKKTILVICCFWTTSFWHFKYSFIVFWQSFAQTFAKIACP